MFFNRLILQIKSADLINNWAELILCFAWINNCVTLVQQAPYSLSCWAPIDLIIGDFYCTYMRSNFVEAAFPVSVKQSYSPKFERVFV